MKFFVIAISLMLASCTTTSEKQITECVKFVENFGQPEMADSLPDGGLMLAKHVGVKHVELLVIVSRKQSLKLETEIAKESSVKLTEKTSCLHPVNGYEYQVLRLKKELPGTEVKFKR
jgi:hypothetical protein